MPLIRPLAWAKLKLRFGVAWSGTFSPWEKGKDYGSRTRVDSGVTRYSLSGMTAVTSISTIHSGRASADTTKPVETGNTPFMCAPISR